MAFTSVITQASHDLSGRERIKLKDTANAIKLDEATRDSSLVLGISAWAIVDVHCEAKTGNKDYVTVVLVDQAGAKYTTSSLAFKDSFLSIIEELQAAGEPIEGFELEVFRKPSKNYAGKSFITCSLF